MKIGATKVTRKGQITIPSEIRRNLGLKQGDKITFVLDKGEVKLTPIGSVVEATAGALKSHKPPLTAAELREAAERSIADDVASPPRPPKPIAQSYGLPIEN